MRVYKKNDHSGEQYNRLTLIERVKDEVSPSGSITERYLCRCECGVEKVIAWKHIKSGNIKSCGCYRNDKKSEIYKQVSEKLSVRNTIHGMTGTRLYRIWGNMMSRCSDRNNPAWENYGGRGITVCDEWHDSDSFFNWAFSNGYNDKLTLDRIDNEREYSPNNCRWADRTQQANNKRSNVMITYNGQTLTMAEWAKVLGINYKVLHNRFRLGWTIDRAFNQPVRPHC